MTYPPNSIASDKVDATATPTDHPTHHNTLASAINDIVAELGAAPQGSAASLTARLAALDITVAGAQPLDSDLTAIAALSTTTFGRALLTQADAAATRTTLGLGTASTANTGDFDAAGAAAAAQSASQPLDSDLTAIAALATTSFGRSFLALADVAAGRTLLGLGTAATQPSTAFDAAGAASTEATARAAADALLIPLTQKAAANGVATLGADGKVPAAQTNTSGAARAAQPLMAKLTRGVDAANVLVISDSTGATTARWVYLWAAALAALFPAYTVRYYSWNDALTPPDYDPLTTGDSTTIQTGTAGGAAPVLSIWNGSRTGSGTTYPLGSNWKQMVQGNGAAPFADVDLIFVSHGHNESAVAINADFEPRYLVLTESLARAWPDAGGILVGQNPETSAAPGGASAVTWQATRASIVQRIAQVRGWGFIDVHQLFVNFSTWATDWTSNDGVHPTAAGSAAWAAEVLAHTAYASLDVQPLPKAVSSLLLPAENLMPNGELSDIVRSSGNPRFFTLTNVTTNVKSTTFWETDKGAASAGAPTGLGYAIKLVAAAANLASILTFVVPSLGKLVSGEYVTLAVRMYVPGATTQPAGLTSTGLQSVGVINLNDGTTTVQSTGPGATGNGALDGWIWRAVTLKVKDAAVNIGGNIFAQQRTDQVLGSILYIDRIVLARGKLPRDSSKLRPLSHFQDDLVLGGANRLYLPNNSSTGAMGNSTLAAGTVTVSNTLITSSSLILLTRKTVGGTAGNLSYTLNAGVGFTINSDNAADTSVVNYMILEPA